MFLLAYNYGENKLIYYFIKYKFLKFFFFFSDDWSSIFGSPTKLGLGLLSIFFDLIFMIQHYVLYKPVINQTEYETIS